MKNSLFSLFTSEPHKPQTEEELQSQTIMWLRFPLALLVLLIHVNPQNREVFTPIQTIDICHLTVGNIYSILGRVGYYFSLVAVPFFFFTSGYFFFYRLKGWGVSCYIEKIKKRLKTLVVPYVLWNLISLFLALLNKLLAVAIGYSSITDLECYLTKIKIGVLWNASVWNEEATNLFGWSISMSGPFLLPLWFLRDLIVMSFVLSPVIYYGIKYLKGWFIGLLALACILNLSTLPGIGVSGLFFFSMGAYLSIQGKNMVAFFRKGRWGYYLVALVSLVLCVAFDGTDVVLVAIPIYRMAAVASMVSIVSFLLSKGTWKVRPQLAQTSFFVYALHNMVVLKVSCLGLAITVTERLFFASRHTSGYIVSYLVSPFLGAAFCLILFVLLKTYFPKCLNMLTGGRD